MNTFICYVLLIVSLQSEILSDRVIEEPITKISFGSCSNPRQNNDAIYDGILKHRPDVFVLLGDNIYGDTENMNLLTEKYAELAAVPGYQQLQQKTEVLATWDDHDFGVNDGGNTYPMRAQSQKVFLDFFKESDDSVRRKRPGIYTSYSFGKEGKKVQIILLDTRYFRDIIPRKKGAKDPNTMGWYAPVTDKSKTLLGKEQWKWLERQLQVKADVRIIASSIQMLAHEKGMENWGNVPHERDRLFGLLEKYKANGTVVISGDVHYTELSRVMIGNYPLYDLTSSGMTHTARVWAKAKNSFRVGEAHWQLNAGLIEIDWEGKSLILGSINDKGDKLIQHKVAFSELEFQSLK